MLGFTSAYTLNAGLKVWHSDKCNSSFKMYIVDKRVESDGNLKVIVQ